MAESATDVFRFATTTAHNLEARFDGGRLTSDGGLPRLAEAEADLGICAAFARCLPDWRKAPSRSWHRLDIVVRQRVFQVACGYQDQDGADTLRFGPLFKYILLDCDSTVDPTHGDQ